MHVRRYHNVCFFPSQNYWPHPPGVSIPGDCPCPKTGGASALVGEVHDDAPPGLPMTCQMPKGHLYRKKARIYKTSLPKCHVMQQQAMCQTRCGGFLDIPARQTTIFQYRHLLPTSTSLPWSLTPSL